MNKNIYETAFKMGFFKGLGLALGFVTAWLFYALIAFLLGSVIALA